MITYLDKAQTISMISLDNIIPISVGGFFHDCAVHDLDLICWILGEYPQTVFTLAHAHHDAIKAMDDTDQATMVMKYPNNVVATIDISRHASYGYDQRCEVHV